jgi:probable HAF family extracellular repeat protein
MSLEKIIKGIKKVKSSLKKAVGLGIVGLAFATSGVKAADEYEITKIIIPDPNANFIMATGINEYGEVVGFYGKTDGFKTFWRRAFLYKNKIVKDLGENDYSSPAINDLGDIVVCFSWKGSFVYRIGEKPIELVFWGGDINNKGEVVGGIGNRIYLYSEGKTTELGGSGDGIEASAINDFTQIVGSLCGIRGVPHAFFWENGIESGLSSSFCAAMDINNSSQIVGYFYSSSQTNELRYACIWEKGVTGWIMRQLDTIKSGANAINDKGQIVGSEISLNWPRNPTRAILYEIRNGELIKTNLNDFLSENSEWERLVCALDINDKGQIVGYGEARNEPGSQYAFVMTPKPKPSADLTGDGIVNLKDLSELANHWLEER